MDLHINISPDRLEAYLDLPAGKFVDLLTLKTLLGAGGILYGLHKHALIEATHPAAQDRHLLLASGTSPELATTGELDPPLDEKALPRSVEAGQVLGVYHLPQPSMPGTGVDGHPIEPPVQEQKLIQLTIGRGLEVRPDGTVVVTRNGDLLRDPDGLLRVSLPGIIERERSDVLVQVDQKSMEAWVELNPGEYVSHEALQITLNRLGIAYGIDGAAIAEAGRPDPSLRTLTIARGLAAVDGIPAQIEMLVDDTRHYQVDEYDRIDFHDMGKILEMKPGSQIARLKPATAGTPGMSVLGKVVKQRPGAEIDLAQYVGDGTRLNPADRFTLEADTQGVFRRNRNGKFMVQPLLIVEGDVDFHNGNIDTTLPVLIKGDIKKGFAVKSSADVTVMGVIEDARVSVQGNLSVKGGILPGENRVKAHGDIVARYISGRTIKGRNITVASSISASRILATAEVAAKEIIAGSLRAAGTVTCDFLGNEGGQKTIIEVGLNPFEEALYESAKVELVRLESALPALKDHCRVMAHKMQHAAEGTDHDDAVAVLRKAVQDYSDMCLRQAECERIVADHAGNEDAALKAALIAKVVVRKMAYVGAELRIAGLVHLDVWENLRAPTFRYKEGAISW